MATLGRVVNAVLEFAQNNSFTSSPSGIDEAIVPAPSSMNDQVLQGFIEALILELSKAGLSVNLPFQGLKDSRVWMDVAEQAFFNQTGAGGS
jgi:hypothetical protein